MAKPFRPQLVPALALGLLAACGSEPEPAAATPPASPATTDAATQDAAASAFDVHVTLSELAAGQLPPSGEPLVVRAEYFGYPTVAAQQRQLPRTGEPWLALGEREIRLAGAGVARFPAVAFDADDLALIEGGAAHVRVTVHADDGTATGDDAATIVAAGADADAAEADEDSLLDCGMFQDALAAAAQAPVDIDCTLSAE